MAGWDSGSTNGAGGPPRAPTGPAALGNQREGSAVTARDDCEIVIANEFAEVFLRRVDTRNGMRLEIRSHRLGTAIQIDALELESLTWQSPETFSEFLGTPYGPG